MTPRKVWGWYEPEELRWAVDVLAVSVAPQHLRDGAYGCALDTETCAALASVDWDAVLAYTDWDHYRRVP